MSLPWLRDDYKKPGESKSRSRSRSGSKGRRPKSESSRRSKSRSRSRSRSAGRDRGPGRDRGRRGGRGHFRRNGPPPERVGRSKRHRSDSSSSSRGSSKSRSPTRLVASDRPKYVNARLFVANILSKDMTKDQLAAHFEKYGNVVDVLIHAKNYAFIQYLKEEHAKLAVEGENGSIFNGMRIDVKMANENRKGGPNNRGGRGGAAGGGMSKESMRDDSYPPDPYMHGGGRMPFPPSLPGDFGPRDPRDLGPRDPRDPFFPDPYRRPFPPDPWIDDPFRRDPYVDPYRDPYAAAPPPPPLPQVPPQTSECVVFYVNRQLQTYAENIERRVKEQSIIAISTIIPEGRTAPQMIDDLSSRGGLFAIFVNSQNVEHRSLTLNILHGTPQEHRNMPTDDAISLVGRSFEKYVEELRAKTAKKPEIEPPVAPVVAPVVVSHVFSSPSSEISYLLNLLADNQALTADELASVIQFLQERHDKLTGGKKPPVAPKADPSAVPERPADDRASAPRKSPQRPPPPSNQKEWGDSRNMDRGYPDRGHIAQSGPDDRGYNDRGASFEQGHMSTSEKFDRAPPSERFDRGPPSEKYDRGPSLEKNDHGSQSSEKFNRAPTSDRYDRRVESKPEEPDSSKHEELTKKILSIFSGGDPSLISQFSSAPPVTAPPAPTPAPAPAQASASSNANLINFDNPNVQKALDNLIQSGPNLLKNFGASKPSSALTSISSSSSAGPNVSGSRSSRQGDNFEQIAGPNAGHLAQGVRDPYGGQGMYGGMEGMHGGMEGMHGGMEGMHGGMQGMYGGMEGMQELMQHMPNYVMQGMRMGFAQAQGYGGGFGYDNAPAGKPPLPKGAPPPPPPPNQPY